MTERERLQSIKSLPSLIKYLREDLDWPIDREDVDDLFFEYEPEELGIDPKLGAQIKEIKQLRPLESRQPWGIFYINFEPKRLPIVVLRKILGALVIKKRAAAAKAERPAWQASDLLFISSYGESGERALTFAHFSDKDQEKTARMPTLRVLGWDDQDTVLHLDHVHKTLKEKLRWPEDGHDLEDWRSRWAEAFVLRPRQVIATSKQLALTLADLAKRIRQRARLVLQVESPKGPLRKLHAAFKEALIHDLTEDDFADMYAQTVAYGLLAARVSRPAGVIADNLTEMVPVTNPFLRDMLGTFLSVGGRKGKLDFDELGIQEVIDLLNSPDTHMDSVLRDFDNRNPQEDPVIHFYEHFLAAYDKKRKVSRGVFYTPKPVVSYIVRSVHELLQTEFGLEDGLASTVTWGEMAKRNPSIAIPTGIKPEEPFVQILDPATGTATFLVTTIEVIHQTMMAKWEKQGIPEKKRTDMWNEYVPDHLLPRLYGYELMMAPYSIAHMKIGLALTASGFRWPAGFNERARVYLTNALEPPQDFADRLAFDAPALAHEAQAVNAVKRGKCFTVVIGNPPYAGHSRNNEIESIVELVKDFTRDEPGLQGPGQGKWLQDDYVKFLRICQYFLAPARLAILAMITNHRYLTNRTFRGMRRIWKDHFSFIRILDLHGNKVVHEESPIGHDENVFEIEQGVAIGIFAKRASPSTRVEYHELWGPRVTTDKQGKYDFLIRESTGSTDWQPLNPVAPDWLYSPREEASEEVRSEFESGIRMLELMPGALGPNGKPQSGLATMHDGFAISFSPDEVDAKIRQLLKTRSREEAKAIFGTLCNPQQWDYLEAKRTLQSTPWREKLTSICYSPFDTRYTVYDKSVAVHLRRRLSDHFLNRRNLGLVIGEAGQEISGTDWDAISCVNSILQLNYFRRNGSPTLPLFLYDDDFLGGRADGRRTNLSLPHLRQFAQRLDLPVDNDGLPNGMTPESIFHYAYAVFHSPGYRSRYAEFLKLDFPRLLLTSSLELFRALSRLGGELVALHLLELPKLDKPITKFIGAKNSEVEKVSWSDETVWVDKAKTTGFKGVPQAVWRFHIGGYQVCEKWLKDRKGRTLSPDDITHYHKIVVALSETIRLMREIDEVIDQHGGWPGAFATKT